MLKRSMILFNVVSILVIISLFGLNYLTIDQYDVVTGAFTNIDGNTFFQYYKIGKNEKKHRNNNNIVLKDFERENILEGTSLEEISQNINMLEGNVNLCKIKIKKLPENYRMDKQYRFSIFVGKIKVLELLKNNMLN